ncbi:MAG: nitronate monooxygenase [Haloarcula sp.]
MGSLQTALCSEVGIDHPVVQAPIGSVSTPELAAAVADAGGLGMLAMSWPGSSRKRGLRWQMRQPPLNRSTTRYVVCSSGTRFRLRKRF